VNNLRQVSVSEQTPVYQPNKILNSLQIDDNSSFFAVSFSRVKDINTSLYNQHKRPFISYALKYTLVIFAHNIAIKINKRPKDIATFDYFYAELRQRLLHAVAFSK